MTLHIRLAIARPAKARQAECPSQPITVPPKSLTMAWLQLPKRDPSFATMQWGKPSGNSRLSTAEDQLDVVSIEACLFAHQALVFQRLRLDDGAFDDDIHQVGQVVCIDLDPGRMRRH